MMVTRVNPSIPKILIVSGVIPDIPIWSTIGVLRWRKQISEINVQGKFPSIWCVHFWKIQVIQRIVNFAESRLKQIMVVIYRWCISIARPWFTHNGVAALPVNRPNELLPVGGGWSFSYCVNAAVICQFQSAGFPTPVVSCDVGRQSPYPKTIVVWRLPIEARKGRYTLGDIIRWILTWIELLDARILIKGPAVIYDFPAWYKSPVNRRWQIKSDRR